MPSIRSFRTPALKLLTMARSLQRFMAVCHRLRRLWCSVYHLWRRMPIRTPPRPRHRPSRCHCGALRLRPRKRNGSQTARATLCPSWRHAQSLSSWPSRSDDAATLPPHCRHSVLLLRTSSSWLRTLLHLRRIAKPSLLLTIRPGLCWRALWWVQGTRRSRCHSLRRLPVLLDLRHGLLMCAMWLGLRRPPRAPHP